MKYPALLLGGYSSSANAKEKKNTNKRDLVVEGKQ